jgi:cell division protease FtsH
MVESLGPIAFEAPPPRFLDAPGFGAAPPVVGAATQQRIDDAVREIVSGAYDRTRAILEREQETLQRCARELLQHETLDEAALSALTAELRREAAQRAPSIST